MNQSVTDPIPIAGLVSIPSTEGITTSYTYDDDLADSTGIDADYAAAITVRKKRCHA